MLFIGVASDEEDMIRQSESVDIKERGKVQ